VKRYNFHDPYFIIIKENGNERKRMEGSSPPPPKLLEDPITCFKFKGKVNKCKLKKKWE